jgi:hypothetical protein
MTAINNTNNTNTTINIPQTSMINLFPEIVYDPTQVAGNSLDIWNDFSVKVFPKNTLANPYALYRPTQSDSLPNLANIFYGSDRLWWITLIVNDVEDPFTFLDDVVYNNLNGGVIKILKKQYISQIIFQIKTLKAINDSLNALNPAT